MGDYGFRDYDPIQPRGTNWRGLLSKIWAPIAAVVGIILKFGFGILKFAAFLGTFWLYAKLWGWQFAAGLIALILFHELGHYFVARAEGLKPDKPVFLPLVAYVRHRLGNPWQTAKVSIAGPILGGIAAAVCWGAAAATDSLLLQALAYTGFFLNAINLVPVGFLDGGAVWKSAKWLYRGGGRGKAYAVYALYFGTAAALIAGAVASHVSSGQV